MENTQQAMFISTNKQQLAQLSKFLISEHFEVSRPELLDTSATVLYAIYTDNPHQKGLRAYAIQYAEINYLSGIFMFDRERNLRPICTRKKLDFNR